MIRFFLPLLVLIFVVLLCAASMNTAASRARESRNESAGHLFESEPRQGQVNVSLPQASGATGASVMLAITASNLAGLGVVAYDFTVGFDPGVLRLQNPPVDSVGTLSSGMTITPNASVPGRLTVSAFGTVPLSGAGTLLTMKFNVTGAPGAMTDLTFQRLQLNEGTPAANAIDGSFTVGGGGMCSYQVTPATASFSPSGGSGSFTVLTAPPTGCAWTATSDSPWLVTSSSGGGSGGVTYTVASNPSPSSRTGHITVQGQTHTVTQLGGDAFCTYSLAPSSASFPASGGAGSFSVTTQPATGCNWIAARDSSWLTTNSSGSGSGTASYAVASNGGPGRTGAITVQGQTHIVTQAGASNCVPVSISSSLRGGPGSPLTVPVTVGNVSGLGVVAYDLVISFDPAVLSLQSPAFDSVGTLSGAMTITPNASMGGRITISAFGTTALSGSGTLVNLKFNVIGAAPSCSNLTWSRFTFNEGTPCNVTTDGRACVGAPDGPVILDASVEGKKLIVRGSGFSVGAELTMDGVKQKKTRNDEQNPTTVLIAAKSGKKIAHGQTVRLQVRNNDGRLSPDFRYTRP